MKGGAIGLIIVIFLCLCCVECISDDHIPLNDDEFKRNQVECLDIVQVKPDFVIRFRNGYRKKPHVSLQKWVLCVLVKSGIMSNEGVFRMDEALTHIPENLKRETEKKIEACLPRKRFLPHEIAWRYVVCYNKKKPKQLVIL